MKNKKYIFIPFLLAMLIAVFLAVGQVKPALAQDQCIDAAGGPIPCPPTPAPTEDRPNPTPRPTKTSLPLANPTQETIHAGVSWSGSCPNAGPVNDPCILKLMDACWDVKGDSTVGNPDENGTVTVTCVLPAVRDPNAPLPLVAAPTTTALPDENYLGSCTNADRNVFDCFEKFKCDDGLLVIKVDLYSGNGTRYDFYCIPDETIPQLNLPLTIPDPVGKDANWTGGCSAGAGMDACLDLASAHCSEEGGEISIWYDDDGAGVYCENQSEASQPAPEATPLPLAVAPQTGDTSGEDWDESCSWASCWAYDLSCWSSGGSGYGVEDGSGNMAYHCDMPDETAHKSQNNLKQLALGVIVGVVGTMLIRPLRRPKPVKPIGSVGGGGSSGGGH